MLLSLYIKNLAIIEELQISFEKGLNILTGETGAGKSLIIKAIQLLMGKRFSEELLRTGSDTLIIEGVFTRNSSEIVIRRIYRNNGRSKSFINDEPVNHEKLLKITRLLVDLHGQHDHQNLLKSSTHLDYLDSFGSYHDKLEQQKILYNNTQECKEILDEKITKQLIFEEEKELNEFQLNELMLYSLSKEYENEIIKKHELLSKASYIQETLAKICSLMEHGEAAINNLLNNFTKELEKISEYDDSILSIFKRAESNRIEFEDIIIDIRSVQGNIIVDRAELEKVDEIVSHIEMLKRKYGGSIESVVEYRDRVINTKIKLGGYQKEIDILKKKLIELKAELLECSNFISHKRRETANILEKDVKNNLAHLNISKVQFKIQINSSAKEITETGMDICEFFISTNMGEDMKSVSKTASGGEISRIMLAIKMALQTKDIVSTLIFDEIDSGISGFTAERVGATIEKLSKSHQIICITHLSQIAGKGNNHFRVYKKIKKKRVVVDIDKLSKAKRIREIATLISGRNMSDSSKKQAEELLQ